MTLADIKRLNDCIFVAIKVESINGNDISIKADSICVHGDNPKALEFVKNIRETLVAEGVEIKNLFR